MNHLHKTTNDHISYQLQNGNFFPALYSNKATAEYPGLVLLITDHHPEKLKISWGRKSWWLPSLKHPAWLIYLFPIKNRDPASAPLPLLPFYLFDPLHWYRKEERKRRSKNLRREYKKASLKGSLIRHFRPATSRNR